MSSRFRADGAIVLTPVNCSDCPGKRLRTHPSRRRAFTSFASSIQPGHPQPIQPALGGISRRSFWTPADAAFELALIATLVVTWSQPEIRIWLLIGLANHATMRIRSAFDFIPKALAFERADPATIAESTARIGRAAVSGACRWTWSPVWQRLPLLRRRRGLRGAIEQSIHDEYAKKFERLR
jgi:hypothetical protein